MKYVWSVLCRNYIIDEQSKNLSLIDLPNRLSFKGDLPAKRPFEVPLPSEFYFLSKWMSGKDDNEQRHSVLVKVIDPSSTEIGNFPFEFTLKPESGHVTIGTLTSILYTEDGLYFFEVCLEEDNELKSVASIPLQIVHEHTESEEGDEPTK